MKRIVLPWGVPSRSLLPHWCRWPGLWSLLFGVLATLPGLVQAQATDAEYAALLTAFAQVRAAGTTWPVTGTDADDIDETFGPRWQPSTQRYDWHRGIDIDSNDGTTTEIVAPYPGTFVSYSWLSASAGYTLVLRHQFPQSFTYNGRTVTQFFTYYLHLDDANMPQWVKDAAANATTPAVARGDVIAAMGSSGSSGGAAYDQHLHWELRVASRNSLESQIANYAPNSPSYWGFDPHIHPLVLYAAPNYTAELLWQTTGTPTVAGRIRWRASIDDAPILNRWRVLARHTGTQQILAEHILDYNRRQGFDATSTAALDTRDLTLPYIEAITFTANQTDYLIDLMLPTVWLAPRWGPLTEIVVEATDLFGTVVSSTVVPPTALQAWRQQYWSSMTNQGAAANGAMPGGDGVANLLKYAFNLPPVARAHFVLEPGGTSGLPRPTVTVVEGVPYLAMEYLRRRAEGNPGITYVPAFYEAPSGTPNAGTETAVTVLDATWERVTVRDTLPVAAGGIARLGRLVIEEAN